MFPLANGGQQRNEMLVKWMQKKYSSSYLFFSVEFMPKIHILIFFLYGRGETDMNRANIVVFGFSFLFGLRGLKNCITDQC